MQRYGGYVGRVGALAVALGIGSAVAAPAGIAWATPDDSTASSSASGTSAGTDTSSGSQSPTTGTTASESTGGVAGTPTTNEPKTTDPADPKSGSSTTEEVAPGVTVSSSGGAKSSATDEADKPKPRAKKKPTVKPRARVAESSTASSGPTQRASAQTTSGSTASDDHPGPTALASVSVADMQKSATEVPAVFAAAAQPATVNTIQTTISNLLNGVVRPVLSAFLGMLPGGSTESPLAWLFLAAARRQVGQTETASIDLTAQPMAATQTVAAAATNQPPTAAVTWGRPDATTGKVLGQLTTSDPEGKAVTVALKSAPSAGTFAYNATTKVITYTPTTAQRFVAATTSNPNDTIAMTISVSDGSTPSTSR